ncbi:MAG: pentapeptide repeat-containing protein [Ktedonobacteraceae bacterium]
METLVIAGIVSLLAAIIGASIVLQTQRSYFNRIQAQQRGWERAREGHENTWENYQERQFAELESKLRQQVQQVQQSWHEWEVRDQQRLQALTEEHTEALARMHIQNELARLPLVEEVPITHNTVSKTQHIPAHWRPPQLQASDLSEQDLSHRYLAHADLREAQLVHTSFFMADLSGALLGGANLAGADLSGANLTGADLRGANLTGANLLVADLQDAILLGANLRETRSLTAQQIGAAIYNSTTQIDAALDVTAPGVEKASSKPASAIEETQKMPTIPATNGTNESRSNRLPETPRPTLAGGEEELTSQQEMSAPSSPPAFHDNQVDPKVADLSGDRLENIHTEESDTAIPSPRYNGKR